MIDLDLEAKTINAMCSYHECLDIGVYELSDIDFMNAMHKRIFQEIKSMYSDGKEITLITVYEALKNILAKNETKWMFIKDSFVSSAEFNFFVQKLKELTKKRQLHSLAKDIVSGIHNGDESADLLKMAQNSVYSISAEDKTAEVVTPKKHAERMLATIGRNMEHKGNGGIATSYWKLNRAVNGGHQPGELLIIAAKTGQGKTAFAMNMMRDTAITQKVVSLYINTEMNDEQVDNRWAAILTRDYPSITYSKIATGNLTDQEFSQVVATLDNMNNSGFYSVTVPDLTIDDVYSISRRFKLQKDIRFLVVDYVGRMETSDPKLQEWQVLKVIAKRLKTLAQQLGITIIMLAQLNEDGRLEGAKGMKNECDLFAYLREMENDEKLQYGQEFNYFLVIDKNRNGPRGMIPLKFIGEKMLFVGEAKGHDARLGEVQSEQRQNNRSAKRTSSSGSSSARRYYG